MGIIRYYLAATAPLSSPSSHTPLPSCKQANDILHRRSPDEKQEPEKP
ncbi:MULTISPECIES: hypothetical protein [unclassified Nodularia (in: cyanobacteria)]|nr:MULTISPECIES: hypothetical protein [unclassified Nodularia (in: cyanobacteria)]MBE9201849.1 hypothetical protein [Nodularia sp. LEGE 06071]MCC2693242.1 hypothetical protein [Nodularia sp. LEGE 04288]